MSMKLDAHSLPDDPAKLKRMLIELQQVVAKKDEELAEIKQSKYWI